MPDESLGPRCCLCVFDQLCTTEYVHFNWATTGHYKVLMAEPEDRHGVAYEIEATRGPRSNRLLMVLFLKGQVQFLYWSNSQLMTANQLC